LNEYRSVYPFAFDRRVAGSDIERLAADSEIERLDAEFETTRLDNGSETERLDEGSEAKRLDAAAEFDAGIELEAKPAKPADCIAHPASEKADIAAARARGRLLRSHGGTDIDNSQMMLARMQRAASFSPLARMPLTSASY